MIIRPANILNEFSDKAVSFFDYTMALNVPENEIGELARTYYDQFKYTASSILNYIKYRPILLMIDLYTIDNQYIRTVLTPVNVDNNKVIIDEKQIVKSLGITSGRFKLRSTLCYDLFLSNLNTYNYALGITEISDTETEIKCKLNYVLNNNGGYSYYDYKKYIEQISLSYPPNSTMWKDSPEIIRLQEKFNKIQTYIGFLPSSMDFTTSIIQGNSLNRSKITLIGSIQPKDKIIQYNKVLQLENKFDVYSWKMSIVGQRQTETVDDLAMSFYDLTQLDSSGTYSYIIKRKTNDIPVNIGDILSLYLPVTSPITQEVEIVPETEIKQLKIISEVDYNPKKISNTNSTTDYLNYDNLVTTDYQIKNLIQNSYINTSESLDLNVDYSKFENFIHFGSAARQLINYKYKLELLENYNSTLTQLYATDTSSVGVSSNITNVKNGINLVKDQLSGFERYLYYESSSYTSSSYGEFLPSAPKSTSIKPYVNYSVTSSQFDNWYSSMYVSASYYDNKNIHRLFYTIPSSIADDTKNDWFVTFIDMIGQHFDTPWLYIKNFNQRYDTNESLRTGIQKKALVDFLQSRGFNPQIDFENEDLWKYLLGSDSLGNYSVATSSYSNPEGIMISAVSESVPLRDYTYTVLKRISNNLPLLYKEKGTLKGITHLCNIYGVPRTILNVTEFTQPYILNTTSNY